VRYVALLRAINVGGHTVKMGHLRELFEELGLASVETFIASGNVIFEAPKGNVGALEKRIEGYLREALGYEVATFVRTPSELEEIASYEPFPARELEAEGALLNVMFLREQMGEEAQQKLMGLRSAVDDLHVRGREVYWLRRTRLGESAVSGALLEKRAGMQGTVRNSTTVKKLAAKYAVRRE
jgi:uncharacterized protein (DUF1697 family)